MSLRTMNLSEERFSRSFEMILREFLKRQGEENIRRAIFSSPELIKKAPKALKNPEIDLFG